MTYVELRRHDVIYTYNKLLRKTYNAKQFVTCHSHKRVAFRLRSFRPGHFINLRLKRYRAHVYARTRVALC